MQTNAIKQIDGRWCENYIWTENRVQTNEPCHAIVLLFVLRKLILQTRMHSHPVGLDV